MRELYLALLLLFFCATTSAQTLTHFEYYFDSDPGVGNGTAVTAIANTGELSQTLSLPLSGLAEGFHQVIVRAKDDSNVWSLYSRANFYISDFGLVESVSNLVAVEYFFGPDPGNGNGTALTLPGNMTEVTTTFAIPVQNMPVGFHTLTLRAKNTDGIWGLYRTAQFYIAHFASDEVKDVVALEYWLDTDPGAGNGIPVSVTASQSLSQEVQISLNGLDVGFHKIGIRSKNADGSWSLYERKLFYVNEDYSISPITEAEFLFDAELGFGTGTAAVMIPTGNPDEYTVKIPTDLINCGTHDLSLAIKNDAGGYSLYKVAQDIEVFDDLPPTIVAQDITVQLDVDGMASISIADVDNGTYDDCELSSLVLDITEFTCTNLGANTVTLTATDADGKVATGTAIVTVVDEMEPSVFAQDLAVSLDANGTISITAEALDNGSFDNCSIASINIDMDTFSCSNIGENSVNFTAIDQSGNSATVAVTVTVTDPLGSCNEAPIAICQAITVTSNENCQANATAQAFDGGSIDPNGAPLTFSVDPVGPYNVGITQVTLTVSNGIAMDSCTTSITVVDNTPPVANCVAPFTVQLDASGTANISVADIDNGSSDNCGVANTTIDITTFSCGNIGDNTITLTVTDIAGNVTTCSTVVTVVDPLGSCQEAPIAICQSLILSADSGCGANVTAADFDGGSTDPNNLPLTFTVNPIGPYALGETEVVLTVSNGNASSSCTTTINVFDDTPPTANCVAPFTLQLDASGSANITVSDIDNGSIDNCSVANTTIDISSFSCANIGENTVTLTVIDGSGNISTCSTVITVVDVLAPIARCTPISLQLDANGYASITVEDIDNGSSDNCGIANIAIDRNTFDCSDVGQNQVTLTVTDTSGNVSSCSTIVTVEDSIAPTVLTQDISVQLDSNGNATISPADIDNGSFDNCGIAEISLSRDTFNCSDLGLVTVTLTIADISGNANSATAVVTIEDPLQSCNVVIPTREFITTWMTTLPNETITIPTTGEGYGYNVDWGDGNSLGGYTGDATHSYALPGIYTVKISGSFPRIFFNNQGDRMKIRSIEQWGDIVWTSMNGAFAGAENLVSNAIDVPNLSMVTDMYGMFAYARNFNGDANFGNWNVGNVTNMFGMFGGASVFNCAIDGWNVGNVTNMESMFKGATKFDKNLNSWNVSKVITMKEMFHTAMNFNGEIGNWDVGNVVDMNSMFAHANKFNRDIGNWNVENVTNMRSMFMHAGVFNTSLNNWNVGQVTDMSGMFAYARKFNQPIGNWDVSQVSTMKGMFGGASMFNKDIGSWNVGNVQDMSQMFQGATVFKQEIGNWNVGNVRKMDNMFHTAMKFNANISNWNVSQVVDMKGMFFHANLFDQNLGGWDVSQVSDMGNMFKGIALSPENYDSILIGWSSLPLRSGVNFHGGSSTYCAGEGARQSLIANYNWSILDGGKNCLLRPTAGVLHMEDNLRIFKIALYPNPMKGELYISNPLEVNLESIAIYDLTGRLIKKLDLKGNATDTTIDVTSLSSATYMVVVQGKAGKVSKLLIKE